MYLPAHSQIALRLPPFLWQPVRALWNSTQDNILKECFTGSEYKCIRGACLVSIQVKRRERTWLVWENAIMVQRIPLFHMQRACREGSKKENRGMEDLFGKPARSQLYRITNLHVAPTWRKAACLIFRERKEHQKQLSWAVFIFAGLQCHHVFRANRVCIRSVDRTSWILIPWLHIHVSVDASLHLFSPFIF